MTGGLRWLVGTVRFRAEGSAAEQLISRAMQNGTVLRNLRREAEGICASVRASEYREVCAQRKGISARARVLKKSGLPFFLRKNRNRIGVPLGLLLFFGTVHFLSLFVWSVEIEGTTAIPEEKILQTAAEFGVAEGSYLPNLDLREISVEISDALPQLSWVAVNVNGSRVRIKLHDRVMAPEIVPAEEPCNIRAKTDGVIVRMETGRGQEAVEPGQTVLKGDLLVSGVWESSGGETVLYHAQAKVFARTFYSETVKIPLVQTVRVPTGKCVERKHILLFGVELPLNLAAIPEEGIWEREFSSEQWKWGDVRFPVRIYREVWHEQREKVQEYSEAEARTMAEKELEKRIGEQYSNKTVTEVKKEWGVENGSVVLQVKIECEEDIAEEVPIYLEEEGENIV